MGRVISARGVGYAYPDGTAAVEGVDLDVEAGERVAVLGANGSGKSTLQLLLGGLVEPDAGRVTFFGGERDPERVRDRLGVLLQDPDDALFNATVREDLEYGPAQLGVPRDRAERLVQRLARELDLEGLLDRPPFRLSGGEKQRAALASVLAVRPDVLLLDEPVSNVDGRYRERILDLLARLRAEWDLTLVTFTPSVDLVPAVADRVVLVARDGSVAADAPARAVLTDPDLLERHGLAPPAVVRLFRGFLPEGDLPTDVAAGRRLLEERFE